jgi:hypothetical protein
MVSFSNGLYSQGQKYAFVDTEYILDNIPEFQDAQDELDDHTAIIDQQADEA